eukprot:921552-Rhodomonas_salina.2
MIEGERVLQRASAAFVSPRFSNTEHRLLADDLLGGAVDAVKVLTDILVLDLNVCLLYTSPSPRDRG